MALHVCLRAIDTKKELVGSNPRITTRLSHQGNDSDVLPGKPKTDVAGLPWLRAGEMQAEGTDPSDAQSNRTSDQEKPMNAFVVFSDLKGYSKLSEREIRDFVSQTNEKIYESVGALVERATVFNTWGDACFGIFERGADAVTFCLEYKSAWEGVDLSRYGNKKLVPRIAAHFGEFLVFRDKFLNRDNAVGWIVNAAARIEPVTKPGEIFVTQQFRDTISALPDPIDGLHFEDLGTLPLAKGFGDCPLFRMSQGGGAKTILDRLAQMDLLGVLPDPPAIDQNARRALQQAKNAHSRREFCDVVDRYLGGNIDTEAKYELARLCKDFAEYERCLALIEDLMASNRTIDGFIYAPYAYNIEVAKLRANCLSKLRRYDEAASLIYGLWSMGFRDCDTLSMLAAQYKRKAVYSASGLVSSAADSELLKRARDLYLEAFRRDIGDFYPAINAAYLLKALGGTDLGKAGKLADYLVQELSKQQPVDWLLESTLAQCELIKDDPDLFLPKIRAAIDKHQPKRSELASLYEQVEIHNALRRSPSDGISVILSEFLSELQSRIDD